MEEKQEPLSGEPEVSSRRTFLKWATGAMSFVGGLIVGIPLIGSLGGPAFRMKQRHYAKVIAVDELPQGQPDNVHYPDQSVDAFVRQMITRNVWAIKHSPTDVTVFSPICPHLGCRYNWHPKRNEFVCPCHGSVFAPDGKVLGGPAPRPLDTLPKKIENGDLMVEWERFEVGIPQKRVV
jgi:menaquinol-cytochrome c reductase iron-sulfur subunit